MRNPDLSGWNLEKIKNKSIKKKRVTGLGTQNPDAGGCADATSTTSADALALMHKKHKSWVKEWLLLFNKNC